MVARVIPVALACMWACAQMPGQVFEVASIRPATPLGPLGMRMDRTGGPGTADPGMYACRNCPYLRFYPRHTICTPSNS